MTLVSLGQQQRNCCQKKTSEKGRYCLLCNKRLEKHEGRSEFWPRLTVLEHNHYFIENHSKKEEEQSRNTQAEQTFLYGSCIGTPCADKDWRQRWRPAEVGGAPHCPAIGATARHAAPLQGAAALHQRTARVCSAAANKGESLRNPALTEKLGQHRILLREMAS